MWGVRTLWVTSYIPSPLVVFLLSSSAENRTQKKTKLGSNEEKGKGSLSAHMESREREKLRNLCCGSLVLKMRISPRKIKLPARFAQPVHGRAHTICVPTPTHPWPQLWADLGQQFPAWP